MWRRIGRARPRFGRQKFSLKKRRFLLRFAARGSWHLICILFRQNRKGLYGMDGIQFIDIEKAILLDNDQEAARIRTELAEKQVYLVNLMASPGAGKTSLLVQTIRRLRERYRLGVIEGDIDSMVDAYKIADEQAAAVQIKTGGACHVDAAMITHGLAQMDLDGLDCVFIENVGNLVCPAEFDTGADLKVMILSVPEGDDKPLKYPLMFSVCDALIVNKADYLPDPGFDLEVLEDRVRKLNPDIKIFPVSCRADTGLEAWCAWLGEKIAQKCGDR